jgi:hypothetical protein
MDNASKTLIMLQFQQKRLKIHTVQGRQNELYVFPRLLQS